MAQMIKVIIRPSREKWVVDNTGSVNTATRAQRVTKGHIYHPASFTMPEVGTHHCPIPPMVNTIPETCPPPGTIPFGKVYTYPYIPLLVNTLSPLVADILIII